MAVFSFLALFLGFVTTFLIEIKYKNVLIWEFCPESEFQELPFICLNNCKLDVGKNGMVVEIKNRLFCMLLFRI